MKKATEATGIAATAAKNTADLARATFLATNRPFVGSSLNILEIVGGRNLRFGVQIKNFGPAAATDTVYGWRVWVNGKRQKGFGGEFAAPIVMLPGNSINLIGVIGAKDYAAVTTGTMTLEFEVFATYKGPAENYTYCEKQHFDAITRGFLNYGSVCKP